MGAARTCAGNDLRRRWPANLILALLVAVVGGTILAAVAGAHRTSTAYDRFLAFSRPVDAVAVDVGDDPARLDRVADLPEVQHLALLHDYALLSPDPEVFVPFVSAVDGTFGTDFQRTRIIEGRQVDPDDAHEVALSERQAELLGVGVGDTLVMPSYAPAQIETLYSSEVEVVPEGPLVELRVVGIARGVRDVGSEDPGLVTLTPAFDRTYQATVGSFVGFLFAASLHHGAADVDGFTASVREIYDDAPAQPRFQPLNTADSAARSTIHVLSVALLLFALAAGSAGLVALTIATSRQVRAVAADDSVRRDIGMTRGSRLAALVLPRVVVALLGTAGAVMIAVLASPRFPIGLGRTTEPDPGPAVDLPVLALGALLIIALTIALTAAASWRVVVAAGDVDVPDHGAAPRSLRSLAVSAGLPPTVVTGMRMATEADRGRGTTSSRSAMVGASVGVAGIVATLIYAAGLDRLVTTPERWGWTWDIAIGPVNAEVQSLLNELGDDVDASAIGTFEMPVAIGGTSVASVALDPVRGSVHTTMVSGRAPQGPSEVVLGADTLDRLGLAIGDTVRVGGRGGPEMVVVGRGVFASIDDLVALADGAEFTPAGVQRLGLTENESGYEQVVVRWAPGVDQAEANRQLARAAGEGPGRTPTTHGLPGEIESLAQVSRLPDLLAIFLALLGVLSVAHAASSLPSRRRREMGILATIGLTRRQRRAVVGWEATTIAVIALVFGVPAGIIIGRLTWAATADGLGVATDMAVPTRELLLTIAATVVVLAAVGLLAGRRVTRQRPAQAMRAE